MGDHELLTRADLTVGVLQAEAEDGIKRAEDSNHRLQLLEEWVPRFGQLSGEQRQLSERLNKERADAVEGSRRAEQSRARHMAEWSEQMKASRREIDEWVAQMRTIQDQHKEARKTYTAMVELEDRIKQMEARLLQWQRLVEETRRKERDQIVGDVEKRWQQQLGEWQFLRDEWNKRLTAVSERVSKLEDWRPETVGQLHELSERLEKERRERLAMIADVLKAETEVQRQHVAQLEKSASEIMTRVESEKASGRAKSKGAAAGA
jgi:chromosome segregation ATPase